MLRDIEKRSHRLSIPPRIDLKSGIEHRLRAFPAFRGVPDAPLHELSKSISLHFASPGEVLLKRGGKIKTIYAVIAGLAELHLPEQDIQFGAGDMIGAAALIHGLPARGTVRSLQFGHLLAIPASKFEDLLRRYPIVQRTIDHRHEDRGLGRQMPTTLSGESVEALVNDTRVIADLNSENAGHTGT